MAEERLVPAVNGPAEYRSLQAAPEHWLPAMRAICGRYGLPADQLRHVAEGTNVVFAVGDEIVKLYPPHWASLALVELAVARRVYGRLPVATPVIHASGSLASWPYVVMGRLPGRPLHEVWERMEEGE